MPTSTRFSPPPSRRLDDDPDRRPAHGVSAADARTHDAPTVVAAPAFDQTRSRVAASSSTQTLIPSAELPPRGRRRSGTTGRRGSPAGRSGRSGSSRRRRGRRPSPTGRRARSRTRSGRTRPRRLVSDAVGCGRRGVAPANRPAAGAVSVPSGFTSQPRAISMSSKNGPQSALSGRSSGRDSWRPSGSRAAPSGCGPSGGAMFSSAG